MEQVARYKVNGVKKYVKFSPDRFNNLREAKQHIRNQIDPEARKLKLRYINTN